jgi:hypothetical protein
LEPPGKNKVFGFVNLKVFYLILSQKRWECERIMKIKCVFYGIQNHPPLQVDYHEHSFVTAEEFLQDEEENRGSRVVVVTTHDCDGHSIMAFEIGEEAEALGHLRIRVDELLRENGEGPDMRVHWHELCSQMERTWRDPAPKLPLNYV